MAEELDIDRFLFDVCSGERPRKLFVHAWAKVTSNDNGDLSIEEIDWADVMLGHFPDDDLKDNLIDVDPKQYGVTGSGCYIMRGLFNIKTDSDDYRRWDYLEENIIEFDFMCTIEEHEKPETSFDPIEDQTFFDLFNNDTSTI